MSCETPDYTDGPCHCAFHDPETARQERYALALSTLDGWRKEHVEAHGQRPEYYAAADAVMAVADLEAVRLRAELASSKAAHQAVWDKHQARGQKIFDLQGEIARLKGEQL